MNKNISSRRKLPPWLKMQRASGETYSKVRNLVDRNHLHTICTSGNCPNIGECWSRGTATFMILGDVCTRSCKFCSVPTGRPNPPDPEEPLKIARAIYTMQLKHCVITSVDRDDLLDGGAAFWAETIRAVKNMNPGVTLEVLIPDFRGNTNSLDRVIEAGPDVISHNLETVRRLTPLIRSVARYDVSLMVLKYISSLGITAKSGIMLGLGETFSEVLETMDDLLAVGCSVMTMGQYLAPTANHLPVSEYVKPEIFKNLERIGLEKGFKVVESGPLVRSSYHAEKNIVGSENTMQNV